MAEDPFSRNLRTFSHDLRSVCNRNLYEWFDDKPIPRITNTEMAVPRITNTELPVLRIIKLTLEQNIDSFKIIFKNIVEENKDEIDDIKIDNPLIIETISLFI